MTATARAALSALVVAAAGAIAVVLPLIPELGGPTVDDGFVIDRFDRTVDVRPDGRVEVTELVEVTFLEERRGIFRDLDASGLGGADADHEVHGVDRGEGTEPWPYTFEDDGDRIRVGDEDVTLDPGPQTYRFRYGASGQIALDEAARDIAELRIDVPGDAWPVAVASTTVHVELPSEPVSIACVYGEQGATTACPEPDVAGTTVTQEIPSLPPVTTGTLSVRLPASAFAAGALPAASFVPLTDGDGPPADAEPPLDLPVPWSGLLLGLAAAAPVAGFELLRSRFVYRDRVTDRVLHHRVTPTAELAPPDDLSPAELATVLQRLGGQDRFLATVIDLELRDVLRSRATLEEGTTVDPSRLTRDDEDAPSVERIVLVPGSHPQRATEVESAFVDALLGEEGSISFDGAYDAGTSERVAAATAVLDEHGRQLRRPGGGIIHDGGAALRGWRGAGLGALALSASFGLAWGVTRLLGQAWYLAALVLVLVIAAWGLLALTWRYQRQPFTSYGRDVSARTRAFRHFLAEVHRDRLAVDAELGTPLHHPVVRMLPYAVALGLGTSWYERFAPMLAELAATDPSAVASGGVPWWAVASGFSGMQAAQSGSTTDPSAGGGSVAGAGSGAGGGGGGSW